MNATKHPRVLFIVRWPVLKRNISTVLLIGLVLAGVSSARASLLAYEGFDYTADSAMAGQNGGIGWTNAWSGPSGAFVIAGTLNYTDALGNSLVTTGNCGYFNALTNTANLQARRTNSFVRDDAVATTWVSLVGQYGGSDVQRAAGFQLHTNTIERISIGKGTTNVPAPGTWSILRGGTASTSVFTTNTITSVSFLVLRIDHHAGSNDDVYLFVNPTLSVVPEIGSASATMFGQAEFSFNAVRVFAGYSSPTSYADMKVDEIRVGETYADVAPYTVGGGGGGGNLKINSAGLSGTDFVLSGSGGTNNGPYTVINTTNLALPANQWMPAGSGNFDGGGNFTVTNSVQPAASENYFRIRQP